MSKFFEKVTFEQWAAFILLLLCMAYYYWMSYASLYTTVSHPEIADFKIAVIGLGGLAGGYLFGTSSSSRRKDEVIKEQAKGNTTTT